MKIVADYRIAQTGSNIGLCSAFSACGRYDKLSRVYKRSISEDELNEANTDAKRLALYRKVQSLTKKPEKHSYLSNASFRKGNYHETLEVDGVKYDVKHVLSIEVNYLTFKPYIKKWSIYIRMLDS